MSNLNFIKQGCVMVVSGPSGCGKTSLIKKLLEEDLNISLSISYTTRQPREGEIDGIDYNFIDVKKFNSMLEAGEILEYTEIYNNFYGTPKQAVENKIVNGKDILFDIDSKGANSIKFQMPNNTFSVFIMPPSMEELSLRLRNRGKDSEDTIATRLEGAFGEIKQINDYDYIVPNINLEKAVKHLHAILTAERLKCSRIINLEEIINNNFK